MTMIYTTSIVVQRNVGRIAERIVANELEARGFRVTDLNKDGLSANADLLAAGHGKVWQIQVKGATNGPEDKQWWFGYGHCTLANIANKEPVFNHRKSFYAAGVVVLVAVRSLKEYQCIVLRADVAERAAQLNLDRGFRKLTRKGTPRKPGKVWAYIEPAPLEHERPTKTRALAKAERAILRRGLDAWRVLG
jgi:hypothetical protein